MEILTLFKYLRKAFLYHWNLLVFGAGTAAGIISGRSDIILPILAAAEILYLAILVSNPRFQTIVNAEQNPTLSEPQPSDQKKVREILYSLNKSDRQRYEDLKELCLKLRGIARGVKGGTESDTSEISDMQISGINRLLWIYLKLLYSKNALEFFFTTINVNEIEADIQKSRKRLEALGPKHEDDLNESKRRNSLSDTLKTLEQRLNNYNRAKENHDFIGLELDRLYSKIASLAEMGINRQDPDVITGEIDVVSASVHHTEQTMQDLEFITGISVHDEEAPQLLENRESIIQ